ncbi:MAG: methylated-DNA--[protein]-cysteine S-methyltransferase [Candidatus Acidiferrales bacterium]
MGETLLLSIERLKTPIGEMLIVIDAEGNLRTTDWTDHEDRMRHFLQVHYGKEGLKLESPAARTAVTRAIDRYFHGDLKAIDAIPVKTGGTPFQQEVWRALRAIPCGSTISYGKLAQQIHRPKAVRAVGLANGSNPIGVVLPCHRVIGANGSLTGYGGGLERKQWLLEHESGTRRLL